MSGALVLVATPIGNLGDLSPRAVAALRDAALICCEDTRRTGRLLAHAGIEDVRLRRVDDHTEVAAVDEVLGLLSAGADVAVVTDAGTPGVSDPGSRLVAAVLEAGYRVTTVPGPVAAVAALVASGFPTDRFVFEGFLPRKGRDREARLAQIAAERRTVIVYESPKRIGATLAELAAAAGADRRAVVAREITKLHEEFARGTLAALAERYAVIPKGEVVLVIEGAGPAPDVTDDEVAAALVARMDAGLSVRDAVDDVVALLGSPHRHTYDLAIGLRDGRSQG